MDAAGISVLRTSHCWLQRATVDTRNQIVFPSGILSSSCMMRRAALTPCVRDVLHNSVSIGAYHIIHLGLAAASVHLRVSQHRIVDWLRTGVRLPTATIMFLFRLSSRISSW